MPNRLDSSPRLAAIGVALLLLALGGYAALRRAGPAVDSSSAEAYTALAYGNFIHAWDWTAAEENFKRAIAADPNNPTAHHGYGDFLAGRGRLDESLEEMGRAHRLDPLSREIGIERGSVLYLRRKNDEAAAQIRQTLALDTNYAPGHLRLGLVRIQQRRYPEAIASLWRAIDLGAFYPQAAGALVAAYAVSGDSSAATDLLDDLKRRSATEPVPPVFIAEAYAGIGDVTTGIEWLNRGIEQKDSYLPENFFDPLLDPLRKDPRFERVLTRMGLDGPRPDSSGASRE